MEDGQQNVMSMLKINPKRQFHKCFQQWRHCCAKCKAETGWLLWWKPLLLSYMYEGIFAMKSFRELCSHTWHDAQSCRFTCSLCYNIICWSSFEKP